MKRHVLPTIVLVSWLAISAFPQQPGPTPTPSRDSPPAQQQPPEKPESDEVVRITTNLVQVDAVVTDKNGKLVTDLKPEEVEIFEDGHKQKITHFTFNLTETAPIERAAERAAKPAPTDKTAPPIPT